LSTHSIYDVVNKVHYDNTPPTGKDGGVIIFDNKRRNPNSSMYKKYALNRKHKQELIKTIQSKFSLSPSSIKAATIEFKLNPVTIQKYLNMSLRQIDDLDHPIYYKKRKTIMDDYINIIYKMLRDGFPNLAVQTYVFSNGYRGSKESLKDYIHDVKKNNFPESVLDERISSKEHKSKDTIISMSRKKILNYITDINMKTISNDFMIIQSKYPILMKLRYVYIDFYRALMSNNTKNMDIFLSKYENTIMHGFCKHIKKDIAPVHNAISQEISSGFVEGNNNKLKLIKRTLYGRSGIVNLYKKSYLVFQATLKDFDLNSLLANNHA